MEGLSSSADEPDFPLGKDDLKALDNNLRLLILDYPALKRFAKAERLSKLTGQQLRSIDLICDVRPIFDATRSQIEGMMPYTRLRVVATGADWSPVAFEAELTLQQVYDLAERATYAKQKLDVLRTTIEKSLPGSIPDLALTRIPRKDSKNV